MLFLSSSPFFIDEIGRHELEEREGRGGDQNTDEKRSTKSTKTRCLGVSIKIARNVRAEEFEKDLIKFSLLPPENDR